MNPRSFGVRFQLVNFFEGFLPIWLAVLGALQVIVSVAKLRVVVAAAGLHFKNSIAIFIMNQAIFYSNNSIFCVAVGNVFCFLVANNGASKIT